MAGGFILILGAIIFNGSFIAPFKTERIAKLSLDPIVFQLYCSIGIFLSCFLCQVFLPVNDKFVAGAGNEFQFSPFALVGGALVMISISASFFAVKNLGLALAQGVFSGAAIITSFLWGLIAFGESPKTVVLSVFGLVLIVAGIFTIAFCKTIADSVFKRRLATEGESDGVALSDQSKNSSSSSATTSVDLESSSANSPPSSSSSTGSFTLGVLWALLTGLAGGSILVPLHYVSASQQGLVFLPAFGVGAIITSSILYLMQRFTAGSLPELHLREALLSGVFSGVLFNVNNICDVGAIPILGYGLAFPLSQCAVFVSGMWGIFVFKVH